MRDLVGDDLRARMDGNGLIVLVLQRMVGEMEDVGCAGIGDEIEIHPDSIPRTTAGVDDHKTTIDEGSHRRAGSQLECGDVLVVRLGAEPNATHEVELVLRYPKI